MKKTFLLMAFVAMLAACSNGVPSNYRQSTSLPYIYPDYIGVTIPVNMAPLTFETDGVDKEIVARFTAGNQEVVCQGEKIQPDADDWRALVQSADSILVDVYIQHDGQWTRYKPFSIYVSKDSIDPYISYRLISPSYVVYEELTISQRCLENYDESIVYDNMLCSKESAGQCINCHNYQQYNPERMQFHARENLGGTVIAYDGHVKKLNMKNDSILSAGVYPSWHPWLKLIVYSTNKTHQAFHSVHPNKVEVFDTESDLIAYDLEKNEVWNIENAPDEMEVFPFWAKDGKTLYYCSAHFERQDTTVSLISEIVARSKELKYQIYKKSFDPETMAFGPRELVFSADSTVNSQLSMVNSKSSTLPRVSPDGRYLMFTLAEYGVFHIWHHDADLWILDLQTGEVRPVDEINSPDTESYHSWSSNGRWMVFSSRRDDGTYTRPFFAHIDKEGHWAKPFELPQADPNYHRQFMRCYNIPEFMKGPVTIKPQDFADVLKGKGTTVRYVPALSK